jgi:hypothetical protein
MIDPAIMAEAAPLPDTAEYLHQEVDEQFGTLHHNAGFTL